MSTTTTRSPGAKGARLIGGALTDETLASSAAVLSPTGRLAAKGLQQYYSPREVADLAGRVLDAGACNVADLTAGDGALMAAWPAAQRYGVEIDADQVAAGDVEAIHGDVQRVYPLLRLARVSFRAVVLNPPFGLDWVDEAGKKVNSTLQTLRYGLGLLHEHGQGVLVAGRDRFLRDIAPRPEARGVYAVLECHDLFDGVELPCVVAFFCQPHKRVDDVAPARRNASRAELAGLEGWIVEQREARCGHVPEPYNFGGNVVSVASTWEAVGAEHARRRDAAQTRTKATHDLTLVNRRLRVSLTPFAQIALAEAKALDAVRRLHSQSVSYFAFNAREWQRVLRLAGDDALTVSPELVGAVERVICDARRQLVPNYPIKPQQRLGFLDDLDSVLCVRDDAEKGYLAGERYPLSVESKVKVDHGEKLYTDRNGEQHARRYRHERKLLQITIGPHDFDEEPAEIAYILEHFDVPDPGDLASLYPDDVEAMRQVLRAIERDFGLAGVEGPLAAGRIRWAFKDFQV